MNHKLPQVLCILILIFGLTQQIQAQVSTFELDDYKLADVRIQSFTNRMYFNQSGDRDKNMFSGMSIYKSNYINANYYGTYALNKNTRRRQRNVTATTFFKGSRSVTEYGEEGASNGSYNRNYNWESGIEINDVHRQYISTKFYLEAQFLAKYIFDQSFQFRESWSPVEMWERIGEDRHTFSIGVPLKAGLGRLEQVQDARQAIFIFQELQKVGRLRDSISQEDYLNLSTLVSQLRNRRFFDVRLQRIYQVKALDTFLQQNKLTNDLDGDYYTTTFDYWMFGGGPVRNSGRRFAVAVYPMMTRQGHRKSQYGTEVTLESNFKNQFRQVFTSLEYDIEKPINQKWQSSLRSRLFFGRRNNNLVTEYVLNDIENEYNLSGIQFLISYGLGYYPTTRTSINWNMQVDLARASRKNIAQTPFREDGYDFDLDRNLFSSNLSATYYVSPRFRIFANARISLLRIPSFEQYYRNIWYPGLIVPSVYIADSYFTPDQLIDNTGQHYNFERSQFNSNVSLSILYSLF